MFDNGLRHTIRLELHTVYDISRQRPVAKEWLGALMALVVELTQARRVLEIGTYTVRCARSCLRLAATHCWLCRGTQHWRLPWLSRLTALC